MDLSLQRIRASIKYRREQVVRLDPTHRPALFSLLSLLRPYRARGVAKRRIGASRDGGYVMLDDLNGIELALSLGIGPDVSWDYAIAERGIPVWQYDHTVPGPPQAHPLFHFQKQRVVAQSPSIDDVTFSSLLESAAEKPFLLKMDIEGDEWKVFAGADASRLHQCRQMVLEFHDFRFAGAPDWHRNAEAILSLLTQDFGVVHVHGNNFAKHIILDGQRLPDCLEVTFANRRFYELEPTDETFPGAYDQKNHLFFRDFRLGRFQFDPSGRKK